MDQEPDRVRGADLRAQAARSRRRRARRWRRSSIFCALSGVVYLVNDLFDRDADRQHPIKRRARSPPATWRRGRPRVWAGGTRRSRRWPRRRGSAPPFGLIAAGYLALFALYSRWLKHVVILDVLSIAIGFVLRAAAGGRGHRVPVSDWLLVCTVLLALFLGLSKRRHELTLLADGAAGHRRILDEYNPYLLDQMIGVVTASTLMAYIIYCTSPDTVERFGTHQLVLTIPFPIYGILRYLYLVHRRDGGGNPSELLITDRPLLICVALWGLVTAWSSTGPSDSDRSLMSKSQVAILRTSPAHRPPRLSPR